MKIVDIIDLTCKTTMHYVLVHALVAIRVKRTLGFCTYHRTFQVDNYGSYIKAIAVTA